MKIQAIRHNNMIEVRKLLQLSKSTFAVSLPNKDAKHLKAVKGDLIEVVLWDNETILIRKLKLEKK